MITGNDTYDIVVERSDDLGECHIVGIEIDVEVPELPSDYPLVIELDVNTGEYSIVGDAQ